MSEFDRLKEQKEEILQRKREALERPLLAEIDSLRLQLNESRNYAQHIRVEREEFRSLLVRSLQLLRPWMDARITWEEWDELFCAIEKAVAK